MANSFHELTDREIIDGCSARVKELQDKRSGNGDLSYADIIRKLIQCSELLAVAVRNQNGDNINRYREECRLALVESA